MSGDRSKPPTGYFVYPLENAGYYTMGVWENGEPKPFYLHEEATAACWAHRDAVVAESRGPTRHIFSTAAMEQHDREQQAQGIEMLSDFLQLGHGERAIAEQLATKARRGE